MVWQHAFLAVVNGFRNEVFFFMFRDMQFGLRKHYWDCEEDYMISPLVERTKPSKVKRDEKRLVIVHWDLFLHCKLIKEEWNGIGAFNEKD